MNIVESKQNPYSEILSEIKKEKLKKDEFYMAIYTRVHQDSEIMQAYEYQYPPSEPMDHRRLRQDFKITSDRMQNGAKKWQAKDDFKKRMQRKYKSYYQECESRDSDNYSNLEFVREMYEFTKERAPGMATSFLSIIQTHETAQ